MHARCVEKGERVHVNVPDGGHDCRFFAYYGHGEHTPSQEATNGHGDCNMTTAAPVSLEEDEEGRSFI